MELNKLETFRLTLNDEIRDINILPILKSMKFKGTLGMEQLRRAVQKFSGKDRK